MKVRVKEVNPLKQGLKLHNAKNTNTLTGIVKEVNPLKQGLKHICFVDVELEEKLKK